MAAKIAFLLLVVIGIGSSLALETGLPKPTLVEVLECLGPKYLKNCHNETVATLRTGVSELARRKPRVNNCAICNAFVSGMAPVVTRKGSDQCVADYFDCLCHLAKAENDMVCNYGSEEWKPQLSYVLSELLVNPEQICPSFVKDCGSPQYNRNKNWTLPLLNTTKPPVEPYTMPPAGSPTFKVLHITDLHYDFAYRIGSEADCSDPLCCRGNTTANVKRPADKWATFGLCDMPYWTIEAVFEYIKANEQFDYILFTGDIPAHNIWFQSKADQLYRINNMTNVWEQFFPHKMVYSAVGNHESVPVDSFPPHSVEKEMQNTWLYAALNASWTQLLQTQSITSSVLDTASYSIQVAPGLRLISLNTNYCRDFNLFNFLESKDLDGELVWLMQELQKAEDAGHKVHIIGHLPPSCGRWYSYGWVYNKIVNRYESTIRGQFFGHTHQDGFIMQYDNYNPSGRPTGNIFVAPSLTTYGGEWPAYRIYTIDARPSGTFGVLDYKTMIMNLTEVNKTPDVKPVFTHEYTLTDAYDIASGFPEEMDKVLQKFETDKGKVYLEKYKTFNKASAPWSCDTACLQNMVCTVKFARDSDPERPHYGC